MFQSHNRFATMTSTSFLYLVPNPILNLIVNLLIDLQSHRCQLEFVSAHQSILVLCNFYIFGSIPIYLISKEFFFWINLLCSSLLMWFSLKSKLKFALQCVWCAYLWLSYKIEVRLCLKKCLFSSFNFMKCFNIEVN